MPTTGHHHHEPLEIQLESNDLVLRGFTGDEFEPATLNGELILNLSHATDLKEVSCVLFLPPSPSEPPSTQPS